MSNKSKYLFLILALIGANTGVQAQILATYVDYSKNQMDIRTILRIIDPNKKQQWVQQVIQDNEFVPHNIGQDANFYANPLLIDGKPLDYSQFSWGSTGELSVVKGNPESKESERIPFYVSIRRNGEIIVDKKMPFLDKALYKVNLSDLQPFSRPDDVLIINPVRREDWKAKRILKLIGGC